MASVHPNFTLQSIYKEGEFSWSTNGSLEIFLDFHGQGWGQTLDMSQNIWSNLMDRHVLWISHSLPWPHPLDILYIHRLHMHIAATKNKTPKDRQEGRTKQEIQNHSDGGVFLALPVWQSTCTFKMTCFWPDFSKRQIFLGHQKKKYTNVF
jgi:hypothetical protein